MCASYLASISAEQSRRRGDARHNATSCPSFAPFADAAAAETEFTAAAAGVYLLSYVVSDGENETWSEPVEINVTRSGMTVTVR
jgi:hypothetical protein